MNRAANPVLSIMRSSPQKVDDAAVFAGAARAIVRRGPARVTLRDIAAESGLTAGRLVQRYGSKRELLLALTAHEAESAASQLARLRSTYPSPLAAMRAYAEQLARAAEPPDALAHGLALRQLGLEDPEFRHNAARHSGVVHVGLSRLLDDAIAAGELRLGPDRGAVERLARRLQVTISGSIITWATLREGPAAQWVRDDLDALLAPYERPPRIALERESPPLARPFAAPPAHGAG
jgi:AcrR family transcriptional regulator